MADLLNDFAKAAEKERHLKCYSSLIRRARPYTLDDDAVELITELGSGPTIAEKLAIYRILARLPFDTIWLEIDYNARYNARVKIGTSVGEKPKDTPDRMGWIMERITDTVWRATTVVRYNKESDAVKNGGGWTVDTFGAVHVISTEGKLSFNSFVRDPAMRDGVYEVNEKTSFFDKEQNDGAALIQAMMWGFGAKEWPRDEKYNFFQESSELKQNITLPRHLAGCNAVDLPQSWEPIVEKVCNGTPSSKKAETMKLMYKSALELQGDLRFLCAALATINEVPVTYTDVQQPGSRMIGGRLRPYMINRIVTIAVPKKRGRITKVMGMLRLAEKRMRRHEVSGYWKVVRSGPNGSIKERRWINEYMRGDASLGYVRQEREVVKSK